MMFLVEACWRMRKMTENPFELSNLFLFCVKSHLNLMWLSSKDELKRPSTWRKFENKVSTSEIHCRVELEMLLCNELAFNYSIHVLAVIALHQANFTAVQCLIVEEFCLWELILKLRHQAIEFSLRIFDIIKRHRKMTITNITAKLAFSENLRTFGHFLFWWRNRSKWQARQEHQLFISSPWYCLSNEPL